MIVLGWLVATAGYIMLQPLMGKVAKFQLGVNLELLQELQLKQQLPQETVKESREFDVASQQTIGPVKEEAVSGVQSTEVSP